MIAKDKFIEINGLKLHYLDWGSHGKPPMLLLHGGSANAHWFDFFAPSFSKDYHVMALDLRGHGDSQSPDPPAYSTADYVSDIDMFIEKLELKDIILIGHSMGGHNSVVYAAVSKSKRLKGLIIVDSLLYVQLENEEFYKRLRDRPLPVYNTLEEAIRRFKFFPDETYASPEMLRHIARHLVKQLPDGKWILKFDKNAFLHWEPYDARSYISYIECPMIYIRGEKSSVVSRDDVEEIMRSCKNGKLVEIKRAYHHVLLDNPREFEEAVRDFLDEIKTKEEENL